MKTIAALVVLLALTGSISAGGWSRGRGWRGWRGPPGSSTSEVHRAQDGIAYGYGIDHNSPVSAPTVVPPAPVHMRKIPHPPVEIIEQVIPAPIIREVPVPVAMIDNRAVLMDGRGMLIDPVMGRGCGRTCRMMMMDDEILMRSMMLDGRRMMVLGDDLRLIGAL